VADLRKLVEGRPTEVALLCERLVSSVEQFDDVRVEVSPKVVVLHGANRIFGSLRPARRGLSVHLNLPYEVEDRRVTRSEPLTKRLTFHRFMLATPDDFDRRFEAWINDAHDAASVSP
jgi:hypothetical protein